MKKYLKQFIPLIYAFLVILVSFLLGVVWFNVDQKYSLTDTNSVRSQNEENIIPDDAKKIDKTDPVRGNKKAKYALIEYSDYDCPFCKDFHSTVKQLIDENSDFKWIFRQFPLAQIHPNATEKAKAAMCVYKLGGNDKFWAFSDTMYEDQSILPADLKAEVTKIGISESTYNDCLKNFDTSDFDNDFDLARQMNITGTPTSIIVNTENGNATLVVGSLSKEEIIQKAKGL